MVVADTVKAVFLDRVTIVDHYGPYVPQPVPEIAAAERDRTQGNTSRRRATRPSPVHVFLRDRFSCNYCGEPFSSHDLTSDHVVPRSKGGRTVWANVVTAARMQPPERQPACPAERMYPRHRPLQPRRLCCRKRPRLPTNYLHDSWRDYLYWVPSSIRRNRGPRRLCCR